VLKRVLIADDSRAVRSVLRNYLDQRGDLEICAQVADGREAVDAALSLKPDLLILDVVMPELNGIEVAAIVSKSLPQAKIIVFTLYGDYVGKTLASVAGIHVILPKPEGLSSLIEAVDSLLGPADPPNAHSSEPASSERPKTKAAP
jgi:DNA-binding NarL/FixJ family response regulator